MMKNIPESDWKKIRALKDDALSLACERIFKKIEKLAEARKGREHKAYLDLWKLMRKEDYEIGLMFDDLKRSNAFFKLSGWKRNGVISEEEFAAFSEDTRQTVDFLIGL